MRFHVYAINWNEERLLPAFFKHYEQAEHIYIIDNNSTDSSHSIINKHSASIIPFNTGSTLNDNTHAKLKNTIWKQSRGVVDFVIVQDLDEFLFFPKFPNDIKNGLKYLRENKITICKSFGYNMFCTDDEFDHFTKSEMSISSFIVKGSRNPFELCYDKCLVFDPNEIKEIDYSVGSHECNPSGNLCIDNESTLLLHYKYIGQEYLIGRYKTIRDRLSAENKDKGFGFQYNKSDEGIQSYIEELFDRYHGFNIFRQIYPDTSIAQMSYCGINYALHTFGKGDIISKAVLSGKTWEPKVAEKIYSLSSKDNTCYIDIGANIGTHVCIARCAGVKKIYAFECNVNTASKLKSTIKLNGWKNIELQEVAISDKEDTLPFTIVINNIGASYIPVERKAWDGPLEISSPIKSSALDSLNLDLEGYDNIILKIDIEGHELRALNGMKTLMQNNSLRYIIIEMNPSCSLIGNMEAQIEKLEEYGFYPDILLFKVPGDEWVGKESHDSSYDTVTREQIMDMLSNNIILEVLFKRI